jgi:hypothetical protein
LPDANHNRDWHIYADAAQFLKSNARVLYQNAPLSIDLDETVYALESIDVCVNLFLLARFPRNKAAIGLKPLLDLLGSLPSSFSKSEGIRVY